MPDSLASTHLPWRISDTFSKVNTIVNQCFYKIAMGKWLPGSRLPTVRQLETEWSVNRQTILKAFNLLASRGLVYHKPNGSYYVADQGLKRNFARDRIELENLYNDLLLKIKNETDLSPLGVLRMLSRIAESEQMENPEVAFVECSKSQAMDHAREIMERLHIPVLPLVLDEIRGKKMRIPSHVKFVFTTSFHVDELIGLKKGDTEVIALPIEISPELLAELASHENKVVFLESKRDLAQRTAKDAIWMMGIKDPQVKITPIIGDFLAAHVELHKGDTPDIIFLVSQKEWEELDVKWQENASVKHISCTLNDAAWEMIADTLKIPFGSSI